MKNQASPEKKSAAFRRYSVLLIIIWTAVVGASMGWTSYQKHSGVKQMARQEALAAFQKDLIYRLWNAGHGGVYAPVTRQTRPNPYLSHVTERDIDTPSGRALTLINPAYMTRQVHELGLEKYGARGHITSLKPIRPQNAADPWEKEALRSFEQGIREAVAVATLDREPYLRFMRPLITAEGCLKCHAHQGYRVGDIRGGISVSVPMAPYLSVARHNIVSLATGHGLIWLLGLIGIGLGKKRLGQYEEALIKGKTYVRVILAFLIPLGLILLLMIGVAVPLFIYITHR